MGTKTDLSGHCQAQLADLRVLADELGDHDWSASTLCDGWTVKDVFAHLLYGRLHGPLTMGAGILRHRGSMDRWGDAVSRKLANALTIAQLCDSFAVETSRWPERGIAGLEADAAKLADNVTHELDVRWAIDRRREIPTDRMIAALDASTKTNMWGNRRRLKGLRFRATDVGWESGEGPEASGPAQALLLAINGRPAGLSELSGPGVDELRLRLAR